MTRSGGTALPRHVRVAVLGAGFAGLGMAIRLRQAGTTDFVVLERADEVGGTWRDNTYPGVACDIPSTLYSYSFAPSPGWSRLFPPGAEIQDYLRGCVERAGLRPHLRLGCEVAEAAWDDDAAVWRVTTSRGELTADVVVSAMGALSEPSVPPIPGLATFRGPVFHTARWRHDVDLAGRRVAVVGTGASAVQVVPELARRAARLHLFQRTPAWVVPRRDRTVHPVEKSLFRTLPATQRARRVAAYWLRELAVPGMTRDQRWLAVAARQARAHLEAQVPDPALRAVLTPDYAIGCKRILSSDDFYPALARDTVEVVPHAVTAVGPGEVTAADGVTRAVDAVVLATGFHISDAPSAYRLRGRGGVLLADVWQGSPRAYLGTTVAGFPNLFLLVGPNTGLGHNSMIFMIESQLAYVLSCLRRMDERHLAALEVRADVQERFNADVQARMQTTVWTRGGCASWYLDRSGRNTMLWPDFTWRFRRRTRRVDLGDYRARRTPADRTSADQTPADPPGQAHRAAGRGAGAGAEAGAEGEGAGLRRPRGWPGSAPPGRPSAPGRRPAAR